jgi:protein-tyrosine phosphatase
VMNNQLRRYMQWGNCYNVREIGGYRTQLGGYTRWRSFIRADNLGRLTPEGKDALVAYGVETIIDLRDRREVEISPTIEIASSNGLTSLTIINLPLMEMDSESGKGNFDHLTSIEELYLWMLGAFQSNIARVMKEIADSKDGTIAFYCHSGKDRTGLIPAILFFVVQVPRSVIAEDYALSASLLEPAGETIFADFALTPERREKLKIFMGSPPGAILAALHYINSTYGSVVDYLLSGGVTTDDLFRIKSRFLAS